MKMSDIQTSIGQSKQKDTLRAVQEAVQEARINLPQGQPDLALVFSSADISHPGLLKTIGLYLEGVPIIGCSSAAIISSKGIFKHGLAIMLLSLPESIYFTTGYVQEINAKTAQKAGQELGEKLLYGFRDIRRDLSIVFSDGLIREGSNLLRGLQDRLGSSFPLVGASASDNLDFSYTYLHFNQTTFSDGACGVLFGGKINFGLASRHGWQPLGKPRYITRSQANIVYEIDGVLASKLYEEYFAFNLAELRKELKRISVLYPIGIYLAGEKEYLLRNITAIQDDGSLVFQGEVPQDSEIRLMIGTKESCLEATRQALSEAKKQLTGHTIKLVLLFDSISRYMLLGRDASLELELSREIFGQDTPILGIYTYGEQAPLTAINYRGKSYFHNQTINVLAIGG